MAAVLNHFWWDFAGKIFRQATVLFISCSSLASLVWRSDSYFHHHPCHYHDRPSIYWYACMCVLLWTKRENWGGGIFLYGDNTPVLCGPIVSLLQPPFRCLLFPSFYLLSSTFYLLPATACPVFAFMCRQTASPLLNCNTLNICVALPKAPKSAKYFVGFCKVVQI